jgi:hypothetical protein
MIWEKRPEKEKGDAPIAVQDSFVFLPGRGKSR